MQEPWIGIGASPTEWLPARVLEFSIHRRCSRPVTVENLSKHSSLIPKSVERFAATAFSFQRLIVPEAMEFKGIAAYLDSDIVCLSDICEMFDTPFPSGKTVLSIPDWQTAVMLLDCERTPWRMSEFAADLESGRRKYVQLMNLEPDFPYKANTLPREWNTFDKQKDFAEVVESGEAKLVHFTRMSEQCWLKTGHPFQHIWMDELIAAVRQDYVTPQEIIREVKLGHVRPSLAMVAGTWPVIDETTGVVYDDRTFIPPFRKAKK